MRTILFAFLTLFCSIVFAQWSNPALDNWKSKQDPRLTTQHRSSNDYDVHFYFLDINMDNQSIDIAGNVLIKLSLTNPDINNLELDFDNQMFVDSISINNSQSDFTFNNNKISIPITPVKETEIFNVTIYFHGTPPYGMFNRIDNEWNATTTYSLSEPFDAMGWFPVKQDLTDKADSSWVFITVPDHLMAGSNGLLTEVTNNDNNTETYKWKSSYPIDYYLISVAIGEYTDASIYAHPQQTEDSILIQNFIYNTDGYLENNEWSMNRTVPIMEAFCDAFGLYPHHLEKYGHCIVELGGGMEHQTMTTIKDFGFSLVAHELGHSWFGNYITCASWQDIWINEGFAVYSEIIADEALRTPEETRDHLESNMLLAKTYSDGSVYVPLEEANNVSRIFDYYLTYKKGGMLVHMIRYLINDDDVFFNVLHEHLATHGNSVATGEDFKSILESISGIEFDDFFNQWYYGQGYPTYSAEWHQNNDTVYIQTTQTTSSNSTPLFTIPIEYRLFFTNGDSLDIRLANNVNSEIHTISENREVERILIDPDLWVLCNASIEYVESIKPFEFSINTYPNPSNGEYHIDLMNQGEYLIKVYDMNGAEVFNRETKSSHFNLDIRNFEDGVYFLKISDSNGITKGEKLLKL